MSEYDSFRLATLIVSSSSGYPWGERDKRERPKVSRPPAIFWVLPSRRDYDLSLDFDSFLSGIPALIESDGLK